MRRLNVVFLCTGNTCRSPLAQALATKRWGDVADFGSAGLQAAPGAPASEGARTVAAEMGADLENHRSRPLDSSLLESCDWVIGMTRSHAAIFRARHGASFAGRIGVLGQAGVDLNRHEPATGGEEVADPFGDELEGYRAIGRQIERLLEVWGPEFRCRNPQGGSG